MSNVQYRQKERKNPLIPLIGFIILIVGGIVSWFGAPTVADWLTTATVNFGTFGQILPISFPAEWSSITVRLVVAGMLFLIVFVLFTAVMLMAMGGTQYGELDITMNEVREKKKKSSRR